MKKLNCYKISDYNHIKQGIEMCGAFKAYYNFIKQYKIKASFLTVELNEFKKLFAYVLLTMKK